MIDYFRDYCAAFSKKRLLSLLLMNDWRIYAGQYLAMNPFFRKEERKLWKRLGELPAYNLIDLGDDIGPKFSVPVPIIHPEMPGDRIPDYMILGYCFAYQRLLPCNHTGRPYRNRRHALSRTDQVRHC